MLLPATVDLYCIWIFITCFTYQYRGCSKEVCDCLQKNEKHAKKKRSECRHVELGLATYVLAWQTRKTWLKRQCVALGMQKGGLWNCN